MPIIRQGDPRVVSYPPAPVTPRPSSTQIVSPPYGNPDPTNLWRGPQSIDSFVAANPEIAPIANTPQANWITEGTTRATVANWVATAAGKTAVFSVYAIPGRDNGQYSAGGFANRAAYLDFITNVVKAGVGTAPVILIYEADALGLSRALPADTKAERIETMRQALNILASIPNAETYVDASGWVPAAEQADLLRQVDVAKISGFANNTSGYESDATVFAYGNSVLTELANLGITNKKYVADTSRNGVGPLETSFPGSKPWFDAGQAWCNPPGRRTGRAPGPVAGQPNCRAALWIKNPGETDGNSPQLNPGVANTFVSPYYGASAPQAGTFWVPLARNLLGLPAQPVGTISTVVADFASAWGPFTVRSGGASLVDGRARVPTGVNTYEFVATDANLVLQGGSVSAQLFPAAANGTTGEASTFFTVNSGTEGTRLVTGIDTAKGNIYFGNESGYYDNDGIRIPYDPAAHAWVRIRESGGTVTWETSPDGSTWTTRKTSGAPQWIISITASVQLVSNRDAGTANYAEMDNVNVTPAPGSGALDLTGSGTVAGSGTQVTTSGTLALTGSGTVAGSPTRVTASGTGSYTGSGTVAYSNARPTMSGTTAPTGSGTVSATGTPAIMGTLALTGSGDLTGALAAVSMTGTATPTGSGALSLSGTAAASGSGALDTTGSGTLTASPQTVTTSSSMALSGLGTTTAAGRPAVNGSLTRTGSGSLTLSGRIGVTNPLSLAGFGTASATGSPAFTTPVPLNGNGTFTPTPGAADSTGAVAINGDADLSLSGNRISASGTLSLTGSGSLAALGTVFYYDNAGTLDRTGSGTLSVSGKMTARATVATTGSGTLSITGVQEYNDRVGSLSLSSAGSLAVATAVVSVRNTSFARVAEGTLRVTGESLDVLPINRARVSIFFGTNYANFARAFKAGDFVPEAIVIAQNISNLVETVYVRRSQT